MDGLCERSHGFPFQHESLPQNGVSSHRQRSARRGQEQISRMRQTPRFVTPASPS